MDELTDAIKELIDSEDTENAYQFLEDLYTVYSRFNQTSNRVLRVLRQFMPNKRAKIGLAECIIGVVEEFGPITFVQLADYIHKEFEYTVTNKSISDSLYRLTKTDQLIRYFDRTAKQHKYKLKSTSIPNSPTTIY
jgi:hypothetical protein